MPIFLGYSRPVPKYELSSRPKRSEVERPAVLSTSNLHQYPIEKHFQDGPAEVQIPFDFAQGRLSARLLMTQCRTYGARILFGIDSPALPGWADVWRSALRASHPWRLPVSFLSQLATGKSASRDDKGKGVASMCIWRLVERTAGPHSTSL